MFNLISNISEQIKTFQNNHNHRSQSLMMMMIVKEMFTRILDSSSTILINEDRELLRNIFDCYDQFDKLDTIEISFFHRLLSMRFISLKLSFLVVLFCLLLKAIVDHHLFLIIVYILIIIFAVIVSKTRFEKLLIIFRKNIFNFTI